MLANACGPCIGQWKRDDVEEGRGELDHHLLQPQLPASATTATAEHASRSSRAPRSWSPTRSPGTLDVRPAHATSSRARDGKRFKLDAAGARARAARATASSRAARATWRRPPTATRRRGEGRAQQRAARSCSSRSRPGTARTSSDCRMLLKAKGKCTTDHISPAGKWLQASAATSTTSATTCSSAPSTRSPARPGDGHRSCSRARRACRSRRSRAHYKARGLRWVVVGDENYGEGSSREHAAMSPRLLGARGRDRAQLRAHPRDEPQEAGRAAAHVREPGRLRRRCRRAIAISILGLAAARAGQGRSRVVLHHADGTRGRASPCATPSTPSRSPGSRRARR